MRPERYLLFPKIKIERKGVVVMSTTISIVSSLILAIAVIIIAAIALECLETNGHLRVTDKSGRRKFVGFKDVSTDGLTGAIVLGILAGMINFFSQFCMHKGLPVLSLITMFIMVAAIIATAMYWLREGSEWRELCPFLLLVLLLFVVTKQAALAGAVAVAENQFWYSVVKIIPLVTVFAAYGSMIAGTAKYRYEERPGLTSDSRSRNCAWFRATVVLTIIALLLSVIFGISWGSLGNFTKPAGEAGKGEFPHYYNLDIQNDGVGENDYNFGPNPWVEGMTVEQADAEFRARLAKDPMLGSADISWLDARVGTQYLGDYYAQAENNWARAINSATADFAKDQTKYNKTLDPFLAFLDSAVQVSIRDCQAVVDQMYANPHTASGIPEVVVYKTTDHTGHELVYTFSIKGNVFEVAYRIECGFQPTNVEEVMHIPAQDNPLNPTPEPTTEWPTTEEPTTEEPTTEEPTTEEPTTEPVTEPPTKNPAELPSTDTERNNNTGQGETSINSSDPDHSSKDTGDGSNSYNSYDEYVQEIEDKQSINATQSVGGDSNTPSTSTPAGANVDNNGDAGTGNGGIDTATPIQDHAQTSNGESISNIESNPAGAWGDDEDPK